MYGTVKRKNGMTTPNSDNIPPAVPNGWYYIMMSSELKREEVKHVSMCGKQSVLCDFFKQEVDLIYYYKLCVSIAKLGHMTLRSKLQSCND